MFLQVASCEACQKNSDKLVVTSTELHPVPVITTWYHVAIDFIGPISPNGNCFFRCIAMIVTGSQEYHEEIRLYLLYNLHDISNSSNEKISCLLPRARNTSMQSYIVQSKVQFPGEWATGLEITATFCLLNTKIHVFNFTEKIYHWTLYSPHELVKNPSL